MQKCKWLSRGGLGEVSPWSDHEYTSSMCWCSSLHAVPQMYDPSTHPVCVPSEPSRPYPVQLQCSCGLILLWPGGAGLTELPGGCSGRGLVHSGRTDWQSHLWPLVRHRLPGWAEPRAGLEGADPGEWPLWKGGNCLPFKETKRLS